MRGVYTVVKQIEHFRYLSEKSGRYIWSGGMGTKLFYFMGAILVLGAGVILVSKRRAA